MTMNLDKRLGIALLLFAAMPIWAQEGHQSESTRIDQTRLEQSNQQAAEAWGLNRALPDPDRALGIAPDVTIA